MSRRITATAKTSVAEPRLFDQARAFDLLPRFDSSKCEDQWSGDVGGQPFWLHELKLTQKRNSGNNRRTITVFAGSLISVGFARRFSGTTLVERKGRMGGFLGGLLGGDKDDHRERTGVRRRKDPRAVQRRRSADRAGKRQPVRKRLTLYHGRPPAG